eukprot:755266-Hanusia_phi.AAC.3
MGWKEGVGLGKNNDGITKHLWTKKREDQVGIGAENTNDWGAHSVQTNSYNDILAKLSVIVNTSENEGDESEDDSKTSSKKAKSSKKRKEVKKKKKSKSSSSDSESSESEDESSDGKSRKKSAKKQDKKKSGGKKKKSGGKKGKTKESSETSAASESDESDSDLEQKAASSSTDAHASRKAGRSYAAAAVIQQRYAYKRAFMNKTKDVKSYSATDLSQILGYSVPPKQEDEKLISKDAIKKYGKSEVKLSKEEKEEKEEEKKKKKSKHERDLEKVPHCEEEDVISTTGVTLKHPILPKPSVLSGILKHMFVHGGFMSHDKEKHKKQDWEFNEETQERIANDAHANKVEGRKGLGFDNDRPTKLGKDFKGAKKTFDSDEDSDASSIKSDDEEEVKPEKSDKKKSKSEKKEKKEKKDKEKKKKKKRARDSDESDSDSDKEVSKKKKKKSNK